MNTLQNLSDEPRIDSFELDALMLVPVDCAALERSVRSDDIRSEIDAYHALFSKLIKIMEK